MLLASLGLGAAWLVHLENLDKLACQQRFRSLLFELPHQLGQPGTARVVLEREGELGTLWNRLYPGRTSPALARLRQQSVQLQRLQQRGQALSADQLWRQEVLPAIRELSEALPDHAEQRGRLALVQARLQVATLVLAVFWLALAWRSRARGPEATSEAAVPPPLFDQPLLRAMDSLLLVIAPDGSIQAVNQAACEALGYPEHELVGMSYQQVYCERADLLTMASCRNLQGVYRTRSGAMIPVVIACSVVNQEGRILSLITLAQDISERRRAAADLESSESRLRALMDRYVGAQEEERRSVAREVHDGLLQYIVAAQLQLQAVEPAQSPALERARTHLRAALGEGRRLIQNLRPTALAELGLVCTLRRLLDEGADELNWQVRLEENLSELKLSPALETNLYRIVQEALSNTRKHAQARNLSLRLMRQDSMIHLEYHDDGQGFDPSTARRGLGLDSMRERAELLGGWLQISSQPGAGTTLHAAFPFNPPGPIERP